jgi:hypothetical protein
MRFSARVCSRRRCTRHGCTPTEETGTISQLDFGCGARRICVRLPARGLQPPPPFNLQARSSFALPRAQSYERALHPPRHGAAICNDARLTQAEIAEERFLHAPPERPRPRASAIGGRGGGARCACHALQQPLMWCVSALFAAPSKPNYYHLSPHIRACIMRTPARALCLSQSRGVDSFVRRHLAASASDGVAEGLVLIKAIFGWAKRESSNRTCPRQKTLQSHKPDHLSETETRLYLSKTRPKGSIWLTR